MKAVIFDMDGVISDTQILHSTTESELLKAHDIALAPHEITSRFAGVSDAKMFGEIFADAKKELPDLREIAKKKWGLMLATPQRDVRPVPGSLELIRGLRAQNIPMAVASASTKEFIRHVLESLGLIENFSALVSADDVENGKPAPDIFLLAAQKIGVEPRECVVIEDGLSGMVGAKAAGMRCVALLTHVREEESPADIKVRSLRDLSPETLLRLSPAVQAR